MVGIEIDFAAVLGAPKRKTRVVTRQAALAAVGAETANVNSAVPSANRKRREVTAGRNDLSGLPPVPP